ncbi:hypothetical protein MRB53_015227 [Persea americana]|uniref:Uncharacterized protein n=1 Tax=Persea americana TaxID=3435 RepID=A0ACC2KDF1_PERAE|nr:hypothetical protein MRB53_015227 [Persea americana]
MDPRRRMRSRKPEPPGWPIIGHILHLISGRDLLHVKLSALADQYGPSIMFLKVGMRPMLVVSDPAAAKECFTTNDHAFASRPHLALGQLLGFDFKLLPWSPYSSYWSEGRKACAIELLSTSRLQALAYIRDEESCKLVSQLLTWVHQGQAVVGMREAMSNMVLCIILRMVGGRRCLRCGDQVKELKGLIEEAFLLGGEGVLGDWFPCVGWLDHFGSTRRAMSHVARRMDDIIQSWINKRRHRMMEGCDDDDGEEGEGGNFMDAIMGVADKDFPNGNTEDKDGFMKPLLLAMIMGTMDTTSVALEWILSELLNNPHVLQKAQEEIQAKIRHGRKIQDSDREELPYLQALVKEALRLHPSGPLLVPHESIQDCKVSGFNVPSGTMLIVNAWKIHRDPRWWDRPLQFEPERFLGDGSASHLDMRGSRHFQFIPFGSGRRACPGTSLALSIIHLTIARLLHGFDWKVPPDSSCVDMTEGPGFSLTKAIPVDALLIPRDASQNYL